MTDTVPPAYTGDLAADAAALARYAAGRPESEALRTARRGFLARHTDAVYDTLTDGRTRHVRLTDLVYAAADRFPGVVPTRAEVAAEADRIQAEKTGLEIGQALLCAALLRSAVAGPHLVDAMLKPTERALTLLPEFRGSGRLEFASVLLERRGTTGHVTFRNTHCLNAEDGRLIADLETAIDLVLLDEQVRVGVLRGAPVDHPRYAGRRVFSAGINLKELRNGQISFLDFLLGRELGYVNKLRRGLLLDQPRGIADTEVVSKPWVGAVDSFAIGGGMQLLLVLDHVVAECDAYASLPAAEEGIVPGLGNLRLARLTGARLARRIILGGHRVRATDSEASLVFDEVVEPAAMDAAVERAAAALAAPAVATNRHMLALAEEPPEVFRTYLAEFALVQAARMGSTDVLAKVERRWQAAQGKR